MLKSSKVLSVLLTCSTLSNSLSAFIERDQICGLSKPLRRGEFSPIKGVDSNFMKGLRFHGKYGSEKSGFPAVDHNRLEEDDLPQDAVASLIQRLFPSPVHDVLAANNLTHDQLRKWLTPEATARLMALICNHGAYCSRTEDQRLIGILEAISAGYQQTVRRFEKAHGKADKVAVLGKFKTHKIYEFATLLDEAIITSSKQNHPNNRFYRSDVVERALYTYMCLQVSGKKGLKPYYDTLVKLELINKEDVPDYDTRVSQKDYETLKRDIKEEKISMDDFLSDPEMILLYRYGFDLYEDTLPPIAEYRTVSYSDPEGETFAYSNCGEATLLSFIATLMFDPKSHAFDHKKLEWLQGQRCSLQPRFVSFLEEFLTSPASVNNTGTHRQFVQLVSNLNTSDTTDEIRYRKHKGKVQRARNGTYEIDAGLDNFLRVLGFMLGDPKWKTLQGESADICHAIAHNLTRICKLFSIKGFNLTWKNKELNDQSVKDPTSIGLVFSYNNKEWFNLDFGKEHFSFDRADSEAKKHFGQIAEKLLEAERPWNPLFALLIPSFKSIFSHEFRSLENYFYYLKGYLFTSDLESLRGRTKALDAILQFKKTRISSEFDYLLKRWLKPKSKYFDEWNDQYTNLKVLNILAGEMPIEEIRSFGVHELNEYLKPKNWLTTFGAACSLWRKNLGRMILEQPGAIEALAGKRLQEVWSGSEDEFEDDGMFEDQVPNDLGATLEATEDDVHKEYFSMLHGLAMIDLPEYMKRAVELGERLDNTVYLDNSTPIGVASQLGHSASVKKLLELGANPEIAPADGEKPIDNALKQCHVEIARALFEKGARPASCLAFNDSTDINPTIQLLLEYEVSPEKFQDELLRNDCSRDVFENVIKKYLGEYGNLFCKLIPNLAARGSLEKLRILKAMGIAPIKHNSFFMLFEDVSMETRMQVCLELLDMDGDLDLFSFLLTELDGPSYVRVISEVPKDKVSKLNIYRLSLRSKGDLVKVKASRDAGMDVSRISFCPGDRLGFDNTLELLMKCCELGITKYDWELLEKDLFKKILKHYPHYRIQELAVCIPQLALEGDLEKLQALRKAGVRIRSDDSIYLDQSTSHAQEIISELEKMGASLGQISQPNSP